MAALTVVGGAAGVLSVAEPAAAADAVDRVVDPATWHEFPGSNTSQGYYTVSRNPGRIWTDKTVFDETVEDPSGQAAPIELGPDETAVSLSAIGSTRHVSREEPMPIDASLIVDLSGSMAWCVTDPGRSCVTNNGAGSRAAAMVDATNAAIRIILGADANNRVAVTSFASSTGTLVGLGRPAPIGQNAAGDDIYMRMCRPAESGSLYVTFAATGCPSGNRTQVTGGTNIERGIYRGMNELASQTGVAGERMPSVMFLTDGQPTYAVAADAQGGTGAPRWWSIPDNGAGRANVGPGSGNFAGNGFMAALTAQYFKNLVDRAYGTSADLGTQTRVYTVGLGVNEMDDDDADLARVTLDPAAELGATTNPYAAQFRAWFAEYRAAGGTGTIDCVLVDRTWAGSDICLTDVGHPTSSTGGVPAADPTTLRYNDAFYAPATAEQLEDAFAQIASSIVAAAPNYPVDVENDSPGTSGYLTMTDQLGDFMEVRLLDRISFCSSIREDPTSEPDPNDCDARTFLSTGSTTDGDVTTYTFEGTYEANDVAGPSDVGNVVVQVTRNASLAIGDTVTMRLPASLLPMRDTHVIEGADGTPDSVSIIPSHPVHLFYRVGPKDGVIDALGDPRSLGEGDGAALQRYIETHTDDAANVRFYTNAFQTGDSAVSALANATFRPADTNAFYRFPTDTTLYTAESTDSPLAYTDFQQAPGSTTFYYPQTEYSSVDGPAKRTFWVPITKQQLLDGQDEEHEVSGVGGVAFAPAGMLSLADRTHSLDQLKCTPEGMGWEDNEPVCGDPAPGVDGNYTGTAAYVRETRTRSADSQAVREDLGNNGYVAFALPGTLTIDKTVLAGPQLNPDPEEPFELTVELTDGTAPLEGDFPYAIYERGGAAPIDGGTGRIGHGGTLSLTHDQYVTIGGLPAGTQYTVTETPHPEGSGFTQTSPPGPATGTIPAGGTSTASFENTYTASPSTVATPTAVKVLENWPTGEVFEVTLCGVGVPLPDGADEQGCVADELTSPDDLAGFGDIEFTTPGTYRYVIRETRSPAIGVTSSAAEYQWTVSVADVGTGVLTATTELVRITDDAGLAVEEPVAAGTPATFTNTFSATESSIQLPASKMVRDLSLPGSDTDQMRYPAQAHTFEFTALGAEPDDVEVPLPAGCEPGADCTVQNADGSPEASSPQITFDDTHVNHSFYYSVQEVTDPGRPYVEYDTAAYVYRVDVSAVAGADGPVVSTTLATCETTAAALAESTYGACDPEGGTFTDGQPAEFVNVYRPAAGTVDLEATKDFQGRPWLDGDSFEFRLAAFGSTADAVAAGVVTMPGGNPSTVTVSDPEHPTAVFEDIAFAQQGDYQFVITETVPDETGGISHDTHELVYDVSVTDVTVDGVLEVRVSPQGGEANQTFTNIYSASVAVAGARVDKTMTGRGQTAGEFVFDIVPSDQAAADKAGIPLGGTSLPTQSDGRPGETVSQQLLGTVQYTQDDLGQEYTYTVTEQPDTTTGGVQYDDALWTVTRAALYDPGTTGIFVLTSVTGPDGTIEYDSRDPETPVASFANAYAASPTSAVVEGTKTITGRGWMDGEVYTFRLTPLDGAPPPADDTVEVTAEAGPGEGVPFEFGAIEFTEAGVYRYSMSEIAPPDAQGMTYDRNPATVTVTVTDDGEGSLSAEVSYDSDQHFVNMYASQYDVVLEVAKVLEGRDLLAEEFTFDVVPGSPEAAQLAGIPEEGTSFTNADAAPEGRPSVTERLAGISITQADAGRTYCYTYTERPGSEPGMQYDDTSYEACLAIADDGRGVITVTTTITGTDGSVVVTENVSSDVPQQPWPRLTFTNVYEEPTPPPSPTPTPTPPSPAPTPPASPPAGPSAPDGGLPATGASVLGLLVLGLVVAVVGTALVAEVRRSRESGHRRLR